MKKILLILMMLVTMQHNAMAQHDSCALSISLLTCSPGQDLYSTFGHTAIRVQDPGSGEDLVFNYGTFEFDDGFYLRFIKGRLNYSLSVQSFSSFMEEYQQEKRGVVEQVLQFGCKQKEALYAALQINAREENRIYRYHFLFNNCTTRARDMLAGQDKSVNFQNILPQHPLSFRNMIHDYLDSGNHSWSKLGIDLLLGVKVDRAVSNNESMFLPDYLLRALDAALINGQPLVRNKRTLLPDSSEKVSGWQLTPLNLFWFLLVATVLLSFSGNVRARNICSALDFVIYFITGITGLIILFMWLGTDHDVCRNNYNLWWALPTHLIAAFFLHRNFKWLRIYLSAVLLLNLLFLALWFFLPQQFNAATLPVIILITFRTWVMIKEKRNGKQVSSI